MNPTEQNPSLGSEKSSRVGPVIGIVIVVIVLVLGALYFWGQKLSNGTGDAMTDALNEQGSSDELDAIEADLGATVIESLDTGIDGSAEK